MVRIVAKRPSARVQQNVAQGFYHAFIAFLQDARCPTHYPRFSWNIHDTSDRPLDAIPGSRETTVVSFVHELPSRHLR